MCPVALGLHCSVWRWQVTTVGSCSGALGVPGSQRPTLPFKSVPMSCAIPQYPSNKLLFCSNQPHGFLLCNPETCWSRLLGRACENSVRTVATTPVLRPVGPPQVLRCYKIRASAFAHCSLPCLLFPASIASGESCLH